MTTPSRALSIALLFAGSFPAVGQPAKPDAPGIPAIAQRFNKLYSEPSNLFSAAPSAFLTRAVAGLKPGRALDVAMGQGRNSVFLARQGWDVTGYDIAETGLDVARSAAEKASVKIQAVCVFHDDYEFGREQWDLIVMTYTLADMENIAFLKRVKDSLKPGGIVMVEQMNAKETNKKPANALFRSFAGLRVIHYEDVVDTAEWGLQKMRIGRIVAQKD
ncbi:MAG TPA: class I SAM-dependent methyltransferase [Bryobacteraceae bacterium]